jgi:ubiquinone/menaquinone biosynthesis C-methylase UbiE
MVRQATERNAAAIGRQIVDLWRGAADRLPFADDSFDAALAINSMQLWPDAMAGLREVRRVCRAGGRLALVFTPRSGQARTGITNLLAEADFVEADLIEGEPPFAVLAQAPAP